jgi:tetratricopeptide (TPR) repeat protein
MKLVQLLTLLLFIFTSCDNKDANWYFQEGLKEIDSKNYSSAASSFYKATYLDTNMLDAYIKAADCYLKSGDRIMAIQTYWKILQKSPKQKGVYEILAYDRYIDGDYGGAIEFYNNAIEISWKIYESYLYRGISKMKLGGFDSAIDDFNRAIDLNPNIDEAYKQRAECYYSLKEYKSAINDLDFAIKINPKNSTCYYLRAMNKEKIHDVKGAKEDYNTAGDLGDIFGYASAKKLNH